MKTNTNQRVLIVGAGSMGLILGYNLSLAKADVTFLVRPNHVERLSRTQVLYCYDDNSLKQFDDYRVITDHADIARSKFDYIVITIDGASMQNEAGIELTKRIGEGARGTDTKVILGSVFFDSRRWFQDISGLPEEQFANAFWSVHAYSPSAVTLPLHSPTSPDLVARADLAYADRMGNGMTVLDSAPTIARDFADIYNASGVSRCGVMPAEDFAPQANAMFAIFAGCDLLDWPAFSAIDPSNEIWRLSVAAMKEIQTLSISGEAGRRAAEATTEDGLVAQLAGWEQQMLPLDLQQFNRFHHGGKVNAQDNAVLAACLAAGLGEGKEMTALRELLRLGKGGASSRPHQHALRHQHPTALG